MEQRKRERESTLSSSNETHNSYLPSLLAPKPLSVTLFSQLSHPTTPASFQACSGSSSIFHFNPFPLAIQPTQHKFPQPALSLGFPKACPCSPIARALRLQEKHHRCSPCLCLDMDVALEAAVRLWGNPCSLSRSPQHDHAERSEAFVDISHKASLSQLFIKG